MGALIRDSARRMALKSTDGAGMVGFSHANEYDPGTLGKKQQFSISIADGPFFAACNGVTDDTGAVQAAINFAIAHGITRIHVPGTVLVSGAGLDLTGAKWIEFWGDGGSVLLQGSSFYCKTLTGYLFTSTSELQSIRLSGIVFNGTNDPNGYTDITKFSTTWRGVLNADIAGTPLSDLLVSGVTVFGSKTTYPMWNLGTLYNYKFTDCDFQQWTRGIGVRIGYDASPITSASFHKVHFHYLREAVAISQGRLTHFLDCIIEACTVAVTQYLGNTQYTSCYIELIGYVPEAGQPAYGVTPRNFSDSDSPPLSSLQTTAAFTCRGGMMTFRGTHFAGMFSDAVRLFDGIGRQGAYSNGGVISVQNCSWDNRTKQMFRTDAGAPSDRGAFRYVLIDDGNVGIPGGYYNYDDLRALNSGVVSTTLSGANNYTIEISDGVFNVLPTGTTGLASFPGPGVFPTAGVWRRGDTACTQIPAQTAGLVKKWEATTTGATVNWVPLKFVKSAFSLPALASGATAQIGGGTLQKQGETHVYELIGTGIGSAQDMIATIRVSLLAGGATLHVETIVNTWTYTVALTTGAAQTYQFAVTNTTLYAMTFYNKLVRVDGI